MSTPQDEFKIHAGRMRPEKRSSLKQVRAAVSRATRTQRASGPKPRQPSIRAHFAKGSKGRARPVAKASRRVVVKMRYASNSGSKGAPLNAHVAYLAREKRAQSQQLAASRERAVAPELDRSIDYLAREDRTAEHRIAFYDRASEGVDARAITHVWADDPRHFRMIVSAEDGEALGDLKPFIRELMAGLESRLGAEVEWLAVDHFDTDNPHSHVLIRGRRPDGQDLFIPSRLISSGIREHAQEIVTRVLGPRLDIDLVRERAAEISLRTPTGLDRELVRGARAGVVWPERPDLLRRLETLERLGLADRETGAWRLAPGLMSKLTSIAEADDLELTIASLRRPGELMPLLEADRHAPTTGELLHVGVADDYRDRVLAVIETAPGELRYAAFQRSDDLAVLADIRPGAIVSFEPMTAALRPSDEAVARIAARTGGLYSARLHAAIEGDTPAELMAANVRRLEAMRRLGMIERRPGGEFEIGAEHRSTALAFEERLVRRNPLTPRVSSYWSLEEQVTARGPTELDRILSGESRAPEAAGNLRARYEQSLQQRRLFLIEQGWMSEQEIGPSRSAMQRLAALELSAKAKALSDELGVHVLTHIPNRVAGIYARRIDLSQGRMALILGDRQAQLVPWRPALERFAGRHVEGVLRGQGLSWKLGRGLGIGLPPM